MYTFLRRTISVFGFTRGLAGLTIATALLFGSSTGTHATPLIFEFTLTSTGFFFSQGPVGTGSFSIDNAFYVGSGNESFCPTFVPVVCDSTPALLSFDFTFGGVPHAITDDVDFPFLPAVSFFDGVVTQILYEASVFGVISISGLTFEHDTEFFGGTTTTFGTVDVSTTLFIPPAVIPLPAALPLFLTGLAGLGLMRRHQRQA